MIDPPFGTAPDEFQAHTRRDLLITVGAAFGLYFAASGMSAFEGLRAYARRHPALQLDEFISLCAILALAFAFFFIRRWRFERRAAARSQAAAAAQLRASERRFATAFRASPYAKVLVSLRDGAVMEANEAFTALTHLERSEVLGCALRDLPFWESADFADTLQKLIGRDGSIDNLDAALAVGEENTREVLLSAAMLEQGGVPCMLLAINDISAIKALERQLTRQAFHDPLTGLANRALFLDRVSHAMDRADRGGTAPTVLFLDLDDFKWINDSFGHTVGDALLRQLGDRLLACLRQSDTCARLGGDGFAILLEDAVGRDRAVRVAERVLLALKPRFSLPELDTAVNVSIGIARAESGMDAEGLLRSADLAMYIARGSGKGRFAVYEPLALVRPAAAAREHAVAA